MAKRGIGASKELEAHKTVYVGRGNKQQLKLYAGSLPAMASDGSSM